MPDLNKNTQWKCPKGHVLGVVERAKLSGMDGRTRHISRLMLFRHAIDLRQTQPEEVDVIGALEGTMLQIRCSICQEVRAWYIGQDAMERLMERLGK